MRILGAVVGGWGALIVLFSVISAVGVAVRQRQVEIGLLRTIGATPCQARRLLRGETLLVAVAGAVPGVLGASGGGAALLAGLRFGGMIGRDVGYRVGLASVGATAAGMVLVSVLATSVAGRRATSGPASMALTSGRAGRARMPWWRVAAGIVLVGYGVGMGVVTVKVTAHSHDQYAAMSTSGSSAILVGVGFAVLAPLLLRAGAGALRPIVARRGAEGFLAAHNTTRRSGLLAAVLGPVIVLTATAVGVLMLVGIDARTTRSGSGDDTITLLNNVITGMIAMFAAIMVLNAFAAVLSMRREELARLRLAGATVTQVRGSMLSEAWIVAGIGVVLGLIASCAMIVSFAMARGEGPVPNGQLWLPPVLAIAVVAITDRLPGDERRPRRRWAGPRCS